MIVFMGSRGMQGGHCIVFIGVTSVMSILELYGEIITSQGVEVRMCSRIKLEAVRIWKLNLFSEKE